MTNNIFRVMNSNDLTEILQDHSQKLVVVMYSSQSCGPCINFKPKFVAYAKANQDMFFVYVDVSNFKDPKHQYLAHVSATPKFIFYFGSHMIGDVVGADEKVFIEAVEYLKGRIEERRREVEQQELLYKKQKMEEENYLKIELLKKLYEFNQRGIKLTQSYSMNSSVHDMMWEFNLHMKNLQAAASKAAQVQLPSGTSAPQMTPQVLSSQPELQGTTSNQVPQQKTVQLPQQVVPTAQSIQVPQQVLPQAQSLQVPQVQPVQLPQMATPVQLPTQIPQMQTQQVPQTQLQQPAIPQQEQLYTTDHLEQLKKQEKMEKIRELKRIHQMAQMEEFLKLQKLKQLKAVKQQKEKQESETSSSSEEHEN